MATNDAAAPVRTSAEISSLLSQLSNLQNDREKLTQQLEKMNQELSTMKQGKREEMRKVFETVINKWLSDAIADENARKQLNEGMERMIDNTKESGFWTVAVQASHLHAKQIEELEKLRSECETLRGGAASGGSFASETTRKRTREEGNDFWFGLELDPLEQ